VSPEPAAQQSTRHPDDRTVSGRLGWRRVSGIVAFALASQALVWSVLWWLFFEVRMGYWFFDLSDIGYYYQELIAQVASGLVPFRDFFIEYPPMFVPLLVAPGVHVGETEYATRFAVLMMALMAGSSALTSLSVAFDAPASRAYVAAALFGGCTLLLGPITANRYDAAVALVVSGVVLAMTRRRWTLAGALVGVGIALKITPVLLLPLVIMLAPQGKAMRALAASLIVSVAPFLLVLTQGGGAAANLSRMLTYHIGRPLEIESVLATPFWANRLLGGPPIPIGLAAGSQVVASGAGDLLAKLSSGVLLLCLGVVYVLVWQRRRSLGSSQGLLFLAVLATILASFMGSKVLSPQYLVWVVPAAALVALDRRGIGALMAIALSLTHVLFPANYWALAQSQATGAVALVVVRNFVLVAAFAITVWRLRQAPRDEAPSR